MKIMRGLGRGLCMFVVSLTISVWLGVAMVHTTVLDRQVVKGWLQDGGIYKTALASSIKVQPQTPNGEPQVITQDVVTQTLTKTFPADYIQTATERLLDSTYDWLEGKTNTIDLTVPIQEKRTDFTTNLAAALEPQLAALPPCTGPITADVPDCIPAGKTATSMAQEIAVQATSSTDFLQKPLTEQSLGIKDTATNQQLPSIKQTAGFLFWFLPVLALIAGSGFVLLSDPKLVGLTRLGRRVTVGAALTLLVGIVMIYVGNNIQMANFIGATDPRQVGVLQGIIDPLLRQAVPDMGMALSVYCGIVTALGIMLWIIGVILHKRRQNAVLTSVPGPLPPTPPSVPTVP